MKHRILALCFALVGVLPAAAYADPAPAGEAKRSDHGGDHLSPGKPPARAWLRLRLGDRSHPTLDATYDDTLGRFSWTDRFGLARLLVSAVIDGVEYEP